MQGKATFLARQGALDMGKGDSEQPSVQHMTPHRLERTWKIRRRNRMQDIGQSKTQSLQRELTLDSNVDKMHVASVRIHTPGRHIVHNAVHDPRKGGVHQQLKLPRQREFREIRQTHE